MERRESSHPLLELLTALVAVTGSLTAVWLNMAPQERMWIQLEAIEGLRRLAGRLARSEGRAGMGEELAGRTELAWSRYGGAYVAARCEQALARSLERMKP
jgi:hypothetical protein